MIITPVEKINNVFFKREDKFSCFSVQGAKARAALYLIRKAKKLGFIGVTTAGSRMSPQIEIVSFIAKELGLKFTAHCPSGELSQELLNAKKNGANIIQHKAGYNSVIIARSKQYAIDNNYFEIPFGMDCIESVNQTKLQVVNIPKNIKRIIIPIGSGINVCGLLLGLIENNTHIPVIGIQVGADPVKTLNKYVNNWEKYLTILKSNVDYHTKIKNNVYKKIELDPIYEAKCIEFVKPYDLFWIIGKRKSVL